MSRRLAPLLLTLLWSGDPSSKPDTVPGAAPNLLVLTFDTLRPDHLEHMPQLRALLARGRFQSYTLASGAWTYHTMPTVLTGRLMMDMGPAPYEPTVRHIPDEVNTLAEILGAHGYATYYGYANGIAGNTVNLLQGYQKAVYTPKVAELQQHFSQWSMAWANSDRSVPYFIHLHTMETHSPWGENLDPSCADATVETVAACTEATGYDFLTTDDWDASALAVDWTLGEQDLCAAAVEAAYTCAAVRLDNAVGQIVRAFDASEFGQNAILAVASDHGEMLGPTIYGHNIGERWELVHAFQGFVGPAFEPIEDPSVVSQADFVPTVLDALGITDAEGPLGRSLLTEGTSDARSFWCDAPGSKAFGWLAPDLSSFVSYSVKYEGETGWTVADPFEDGPAPSVDVENVPPDAVTALLDQEQALLTFCPPVDP